jgi:hypothetical protein
MKDDRVYEATLQAIQDEFPGFRIERKSDSRLMSVLAALHFLATLGQRTFMDTFTTVLGDTVYVPRSWDDGRKGYLDKAVTLRHEAVHLRQRRHHGTVVFFLLYTFPYFPMFFAKWRARFEQEAYEETLRATAELAGAQYVMRKDLRDRIIGHFTGPAYLWMWIRRRDVEKWYDDARQKIVEDHLKGR